MFRHSGRRHPAEVTEADLFAWCTAPREDSPAAAGRCADNIERANNTVHQRLSTVRTFYRWCLRKGIVRDDPTVDLDGLKKSFPKTYGKVQQRYPGRWLTYDQAFGQFLGACKDGTWVGSRDQLAIRLGLLGLLGLRANEVVRLSWGHVHDGKLALLGKGRRLRLIEPVPVFMDRLAKWRRKYELELGRPIHDDDPILCRQVLGAARQGGPRRVDWGTRLATRTFTSLLATRAGQAELGHLARHDLRR